MSAVEDVATAIAATVREKGWEISVDRRYIDISGEARIATLCCKDASQAKRLTEMMRAPRPSVFAATGIDPVDPLERFPSIRGKA